MVRRVGEEKTLKKGGTKTTTTTKLSHGALFSLCIESLFTFASFPTPFLFRVTSNIRCLISFGCCTKAANVPADEVAPEAAEAAAVEVVGQP